MYKKIIKEEVFEATCDICGADCMKEIFAANDGDSEDKEISKSFEGMELKATWGYPSNKDGEIWEGVVCEDCVDKHLSPLIMFMRKPYF